MNTIAKRRWVAGLGTLLSSAATTAWLFSKPGSLRGAAYLSGWMLLSTIFVLTLYNFRKKLPYPPLLNSAIWLQLHIYLGLFCTLLFALHVGLHIPNGPFEVALAAVFAIVVVSGLIGLFLSRFIPRWLALRGEDVLFERIPNLRKQVRERAEKLIVQSVAETDVTTLANFYRDRLNVFFSTNPVWAHVIQSKRGLHSLVEDLKAINRYLDSREKEIGGELVELVETKDSLDYHYAMQGLLKIWLFVHIPATYVMLLMVALHVWLVYAFAGHVQ